MKKVNLTLIFLFLFIACSFAQSDYKIVNRIPAPGNGGWDYLTVDESASRLYVSHGNEMNVIDLTTNKLVGTIPDTKGVHGIALAQDLGKGFISNGRDTSVTVIDLKTLKFIVKVKVTGNNPDAILYDPFSHKVFTFNGRSSNSTVIDARTNKVIGTIKLSGKFNGTDYFISTGINDCRVRTSSVKSKNIVGELIVQDGIRINSRHFHFHNKF